MSDASVTNLLRLDSIHNGDISIIGPARRFLLQNVFAGTKPLAPREALVEFTLPENPGIGLPMVHPSLYHKPHRMAYRIAKVDDDGTHHSFTNAFNMFTSQFKIWHLRRWSQHSSRIPRLKVREEDGDVILNMALSAVEGRSDIVVLDAKNMEIARAEMANVFPIGFHGIWNPKNALIL